MVWSRDGSVKKHVGPKLKRMFFSNIRFCQRGQTAIELVAKAPMDL